MKIIFLVGLPGSGKSSILQKVVENLPSLQVINYADKMLQEASLQGLGRDDLRKLPFENQQLLGIKAAEKIALEVHKIALVDTHALIKTDSGYCPGFPPKVLDILSPIAFALVECPSHLLLQRRASDQSRKRDLETEKQIILHQELTRSYLTTCSATTGGFLCHIHNESSDLHQNALPLIRFIQSIDT